MKQTAKRIARMLLGGRRYDHLLYRRHYRWLLNHSGFPNGKAQGEDAYIAKWRQIGSSVEPYSYRLFSHFCGPTPDIIPEDIMHATVEACLNPREQWDIYEDKNNFAKYVGTSILPQTVAFRQAGGSITYHSQLSTLNSPLSTLNSPLILKPSVGTSCGESIMRFDRVGEGYCAADGTRLTDDFLRSFGTDWVLQEAVVQHPLLQRFCSTAVCTVRLVVYRSVVDGSPHVTAAILRVGKDGSVVDNIDAGGRFLGIDIADGHIRGPFFNRQGQRSNVWNDFDITSGDYHIPSWDAVIDQAIHVANGLGPHHLIALDITVNDKEKPMLIEYNIGGFTTYFFHFTGQTVLGPWTDEVISYIKPRQGQN